MLRAASAEIADRATAGRRDMAVTRSLLHFSFGRVYAELEMCGGDPTLLVEQLWQHAVCA